MLIEMTEEKKTKTVAKKAVAKAPVSEKASKPVKKSS
jgi:hypothetical protein